MLKYGKHPKAGRYSDNHDGSPKAGHIESSGAGIRVTDAEKFARLNTPEVLSAFYPAGDSTSVALLQALEEDFL